MSNQVLFSFYLVFFFFFLARTAQINSSSDNLSSEPPELLYMSVKPGRIISGSWYCGSHDYNQAQDSAQDYLPVHNAARAAVGVGPLVWDYKVAAYVQNYADQPINDCQLVHSDGPYGENIAWSSGDLSGADAVKLFVDEKKRYNYTSNQCIGGVCNHYTQVVWRDTTRLGCAKVRCSDGGTFIGCNYDPIGNIVGQRPY